MSCVAGRCLFWDYRFQRQILASQETHHLLLLMYWRVSHLRHLTAYLTMGLPAIRVAELTETTAFREYIQNSTLLLSIEEDDLSAHTFFHTISESLMQIYLSGV